MTSIDLETNLDPSELALSLAATAQATGISDSLIKALAATEDRETVPERYMYEAMIGLADAGRALDEHICETFDQFLAHELGYAHSLQKARTPTSRQWRTRPPFSLTQDQLDELVQIIGGHFRIFIRAAVTDEPGGLPAWQETRWRSMGILGPDVRVRGLVRDVFVAGRLAHILNDATSLQEARQMAREFPMSRESALALQAVQDRVSWDLSGGVGYRAQRTAGDLVLGHNSQRVQDIMLDYRRGELRHTPTNRAGLPAEVVATTETDRIVSGWRGLGREMRNRMAAVDRNRDWERVAASTLRMTHSIGVVSAMAEEGITELYYHVQSGACAHCKKLYLNPDGSPRIFKVSDIMQTIAETGGTNAGRRASMIGDADLGWLANALAHPWCQCRPRRRVVDSRIRA